MVPLVRPTKYQMNATAMMDIHHFQSHSQRGPFDTVLASRSFIASSNIGECSV